MKILIVEDETLVAEQLQEQLQEIGYQHTEIVANSNKASELFDDYKPDFLIIDIGLKDSPMDGVQLCRQLQLQRRTPAIFLSGYSDQTTLLKVKSVPHANFLVKPCSTRQLYVSIDQAIDQISKQQPTIPQYYQGAHDDHFFVKGSGNIYEKVTVEQLSWIEAVRGGIQLCLANGKNYILTASLNSFLLQFQHPDLVRVHRSYLINRNQLTGIKERSFIMKFKNLSKEIPSSQSYWNEIKKQFKTLRSD